MISSVVSGCAGFVGSWLSQALLDKGHRVIGIDLMLNNYPTEVKLKNMASFMDNPLFEYHDMEAGYIGELHELKEVDYVFHMAALPGVRQSWKEFRRYTYHNLDQLKDVLDWSSGHKVKKFIFASSSSVYHFGDEVRPSRETDPPKPLSPYGVTKVAGESLCGLYPFPVAILRFFSVFGPRQRPDMGIYKFIQGILEGKEIEVYGDGTYLRDFSYVSDIIDGITAVTESRHSGVFNLGTGKCWKVINVVKTIEHILGMRAKIKRRQDIKDTICTCACLNKAIMSFGYEPKVEFIEGLRRQIEWQKNNATEKK